MGKAILDYQSGNYSEDLITATHISFNDVLSLPYLFRSFEDMPKIEQTALELVKGEALDVGCAAGSHSLYLQQQGISVTSIDISEGSIITCRKRGLKHAYHRNLMDESGHYDTIFFLMVAGALLAGFIILKKLRG